MNLELEENSKSFPLVENTIKATSASHSTEISWAFLSNPVRRFENVTCRLILFSIRGWWLGGASYSRAVNGSSEQDGGSSVGDGRRPEIAIRVGNGGDLGRNGGNGSPEMGGEIFGDAGLGEIAKENDFSTSHYPTSTLHQDT